MSWSFARIQLVGQRTLLGALVVTAAGSGAFLASTDSASNGSITGAKSLAEPEKVRRLGHDIVVVPRAVGQNVGLREFTVSDIVRPIRLPPLQGCLALETNRLARVHSRFAGELIACGTTNDAAEPNVSTQSSTPLSRPWRVGDAVRKGDLLAVIWSKDLGEKKSELVDAVSRLRSDEITYRRLEAAFKDNSVPERSLREAERAVEADLVALDRAERTLKAWRLSDEEIAAVRAEADKLIDGPRRAAARDWARVEIRSPQDGTILEKNGLAVGQWIDTANPLFQIGDLSTLQVWAHIYEEDLPLLHNLAKPIRWTVQFPSRPGVSFPGRLEQIGAAIDPNQHTALVTGRVENPKGELKVGQFVTVSIELPPAAGEIELPSDAVVEDGRESIVFRRMEGLESGFQRVPVHVTRRFRDGICIEAGAVKCGDRVITSGSLQLRDAMDELPVSTAPK